MKSNPLMIDRPLARCLGGPLDGKVKPVVGRRRECLVLPQMSVVEADLEQAPDPMRHDSYCYYSLARNFEGEFFWICDES